MCQHPDQVGQHRVGGVHDLLADGEADNLRKVEVELLPRSLLVEAVPSVPDLPGPVVDCELDRSQQGEVVAIEHVSQGQVDERTALQDIEALPVVLGQRVLHAWEGIEHASGGTITCVEHPSSEAVHVTVVGDGPDGPVRAFDCSRLYDVQGQSVCGLSESIGVVGRLEGDRPVLRGQGVLRHDYLLTLDLFAGILVFLTDLPLEPRLFAFDPEGTDFNPVILGFPAGLLPLEPLRLLDGHS